MKKKGTAALGVAAIAVALTLISPSMANALNWAYFAGPYPAVNTTLTQNQTKNSSVTTNAGGKGKLYYPTIPVAIVFKMRTIRNDVSQYVVGSGQTGGGAALQYTHQATGNTYVTCYWTYTDRISGTASADCARGF